MRDCIGCGVKSFDISESGECWQCRTGRAIFGDGPGRGEALRELVGAFLEAFSNFPPSGSGIIPGERFLIAFREGVAEGTVRHLEKSEWLPRMDVHGRMKMSE